MSGTRKIGSTFPLLLLGTSAWAQTVGPAVRVSDPLQGACAEPAIVASPKLAKVVLVDWIRQSGPVVQYADSLDGAATFTAPQQFAFNLSDPCVQSLYSQGDPMVAASAQTGDLYAGAVGGDANGNGWFYVGRRPFGSTSQIVAVQAIQCGAQHGDKGFTAIGPASASSNAPEVMYLGYAVDNPQWFTKSSTATPVGGQWPNAPTQLLPGGLARNGKGLFPVVVPFGTHKSRAIFVYSRTHSAICAWCAPPAVTWSDDGGATWTSELGLDLYGPNNNTSIAPVEPPVSVAGMPTNFHYTLPSVALDPNNSDVVYVVFPGGANTSATNVDLFVARGQADQQTGVLVFTTYRVAGAQVGESATYDMWLPSIAIDGLGGIDLMYWRTASPDSTPPEQVTATVRYARFASFSQILGGQNASFWADLSQPVQPNPEFGDYHMLTAVGCGTLYGAWVTNQSGLAQVYVNRIDVSDSCSLADFDTSGLVNIEDAAAFTNAFAAAQPSADVNRDQTLNVQDATTFFSAWNNVPHQP